MNIQQMTINDLDNELMVRFAESNLTEDFYDAVVTELKARYVHPEVMATLMTVGELSWRKKHKRQGTFNTPTQISSKYKPIFSVENTLKATFLQSSVSIEKTENEAVLFTWNRTAIANISEKANLRGQNFQFLN